jgi:hypothetical protein
VRCEKPFQAVAKTGQYVRKYCSKFCAKRFHGKAIDRFWAKTNKNAPNGCWEWTGSKSPWGYPNFRDDGVIGGHIWAYKHFKGPVPKGHVVMHTCDNPGCVNPDHLLLGTLTQNSQDMLHKGRSGNAKLKPTQVRNIADRLRSKAPKWSLYKPIADEFGVTENMIYHLHIGHTWHKVSGLPKLKLSGKNDLVTGTGDKDN